MANWWEEINISCVVSELDMEEYPFLFLLFDEEKKLLTFNVKANKEESCTPGIGVDNKVILAFENTLMAQYFLASFPLHHKVSVWKVNREGYENLQKDSGHKLVLWYPADSCYVGLPGYYHYN